ncbi:hypothetical protein SRB5_43850 [Streptomyces sp. RB5]|uniref:Uncharacterized protein n=1 Tax=Streptomyces smaragdinus TaxID=2585196 RepID=A0A7K0CLT5_9ACTN|nr:hypothetical protein [Streptomyces smaragdinus]MQY14223.1 hypothetical protein [Streptomyces smaragdinus]
MVVFIAVFTGLGVGIITYTCLRRQWSLAAKQTIALLAGFLGIARNHSGEGPSVLTAVIVAVPAAALVYAWTRHRERAAG